MKKSQFIGFNLFYNGPRAVMLFVLLSFMLKMPTSEAIVISLICFAYDVHTQTTIDYLNYKIKQFEKQSKKDATIK